MQKYKYKVREMLVDERGRGTKIPFLGNSPVFKFIRLRVEL